MALAGLASLSRGGAIALAAFPLIPLEASDFYLQMLTQMMILAIFAMSLDLLQGVTGLVSLGHAAFFGIGAYGVAIATTRVGPTWEALAVGVAGALGLSLVLSLAVGLFSLRVRAIFFAMITLAVASAFLTLASQLSEFTGGEDGLQGVPRGHLFGVIDLSNNIAMYYLVFAVFCIGFFIIYRAIHSPFGQILKAIRENEPRAISLGYDTDRFKLVAFALSAGLSGLAGGMMTIVFQVATHVEQPG